jgi:hypothetical protein
MLPYRPTANARTGEPKPVAKDQLAKTCPYCKRSGVGNGEPEGQKQLQKRFDAAPEFVPVRVERANLMGREVNVFSLDQET